MASDYTLDVLMGSDDVRRLLGWAASLDAAGKLNADDAWLVHHLARSIDVEPKPYCSVAPAE